MKQAIKAKTLEVWLRLDHLIQAGGGAITIKSLDGGAFDSIVFAECEPKRWMAGSNGFVRTQSFQGPEETKADKQFVHIAIVYDADGTITGYRNGQLYGQPYKSNGPTTFDAEKINSSSACVTARLAEAKCSSPRSIAPRCTTAR